MQNHPAKYAPEGLVSQMLDESAQPEQWPDELLVVRCQARDEQAFRELVRRWEPRLYYYLRRIIEDESAVWDVLQNTWLAAFRHVSRLEQARTFGSWIYRIAHDQAVNWLRKERRYTLQPDEVVEPPTENNAVISVTSEDAALIHQALQRLPPHHREVLTLYYLEEFSAPQIARIIGLPEGTVKSRLHHARKNLVRALKEAGYERE